MTGVALTGAPMLQFELAVGAPVDAGSLHGTQRRYIPILGGSVRGDYDGVVLPGGADWQDIAPDGSLEINARYVLDLGGRHVEVDSRGLRAGSPEVLARLASGEAVDPADYYFRTAMRFRTAAPDLAYLNRLLAVTTGKRRADRVHLDIFRIA